jgi:hypothetical protein
MGRSSKGRTRGLGTKAKADFAAYVAARNVMDAALTAYLDFVEAAASERSADDARFYETAGLL